MLCYNSNSSQPPAALGGFGILSFITAILPANEHSSLLAFDPEKTPKERSAASKPASTEHISVTWYKHDLTDLYEHYRTVQSMCVYTCKKVLSRHNSGRSLRAKGLKSKLVKKKL